MQNFYVYGLYKKNFNKKQNLESGLFYIGITCDLYRRNLNHKNIEYEHNKSKNILKKRIIQKYDFNIFVFWKVLSLEDALEREQFLIRWFGSLYDNSGILTNIRYTGSKFYKGVSKFTPEQQKMHVEEWIKSGKSASEYSRMLGMDNKTITNWAKKYYHKKELPIKSPSPKIDKNIIDSLLNEYDKVCLNTSKTAFAKANNIDRHRFNEWVCRYRPDIIDKQKKK